MGSSDPIESVLWANVLALMTHHYGKEHLSKLAKKAGVAVATVSRIKEQQTSVGVKLVESIARAYDLQAWQLLTPGFDPSNPPVLRPVSAAEAKLYERLQIAAEELARYKLTHPAE
jgi:transcriptional regulator with XRE-family HTH domain